MLEFYSSYGPTVQRIRHFIIIKQYFKSRLFEIIENKSQIEFNKQIIYRAD